MGPSPRLANPGRHQGIGQPGLRRRARRLCHLPVRADALNGKPLRLFLIGYELAVPAGRKS